jgi:hypothetical protein
MSIIPEDPRDLKISPAILRAMQACFDGRQTWRTVHGEEPVIPSAPAFQRYYDNSASPVSDLRWFVDELSFVYLHKDTVRTKEPYNDDRLWGEWVMANYHRVCDAWIALRPPPEPTLADHTYERYRHLPLDPHNLKITPKLLDKMGACSAGVNNWIIAFGETPTPLNLETVRKFLKYGGRQEVEWLINRLGVAYTYPDNLDVYVHSPEDAVRRYENLCAQWLRRQLATPATPPAEVPPTPEEIREGSGHPRVSTYADTVEQMLTEPEAPPTPVVDVTQAEEQFREYDAEEGGGESPDPIANEALDAEITEALGNPNPHHDVELDHQELNGINELGGEA